MTQSPSPASDGQATANPPSPVSPVQARLKWMEVATRLLLLASVAIFAWAALSVFIGPIARKLIEEPKFSRALLPNEEPSESPLDFYRSGDEDNDDVPPPHARDSARKQPPVVDTDDSDNDRKEGGNAKLIPAAAIHDAKLYGQPSEQSVEIGEVRAGESIFIMKQGTDWVLVLRGEGAMLGWMRRANANMR